MSTLVSFGVAFSFLGHQVRLIADEADRHVLAAHEAGANGDLIRAAEELGALMVLNDELLALTPVWQALIPGLATEAAAQLFQL